MDTEEIKRKIEEEKRELSFFLRLVRKYKLDKNDVEKQVNFYLERIYELMQRLKKNS